MGLVRAARCAVGSDGLRAVRDPPALRTHPRRAGREDGPGSPGRGHRRRHSAPVCSQHAYCMGLQELLKTCRREMAQRLSGGRHATRTDSRSDRDARYPGAFESGGSLVNYVYDVLDDHDHDLDDHDHDHRPPNVGHHTHSPRFHRPDSHGHDRATRNHCRDPATCNLPRGGDANDIATRNLPRGADADQHAAACVHGRLRRNTGCCRHRPRQCGRTAGVGSSTAPPQAVSVVANAHVSCPRNASSGSRQTRSDSSSSP